MLEAVLFTAALFTCMMGMLEFGRRLHRQHKDRGDALLQGVGTLEGAVFGLFGLLLAFSFSGAVDRFSARRALIVKETNAIGSAWNRLDLLPAKERAEQQERLRKYLDTRLAAYHKLPDVEQFMAGLSVADHLYKDIWSAAVASSLDPNRPLQYAQILLPSLQQMSDVALERTSAFRNHPPPVIQGMLFALSLLSSLLAGYTLGDHDRRRAMHRIVFAAAVAITVYVTIDLEYPRFGLIRIDSADVNLLQLRESMK